jgi:hypothetical protein
MVDQGNDGKLVHVSGFVSVEGALEDDVFGVRADGAVRLLRDVEMYQWVERSHTESETNLGGSEERTTTYEYVQEWRSDSNAADSSRFHAPAGHENPSFPYESRNVSAQRVALGGFVLAPSQVDQLRRSEPLPVASLPSSLGRAAKLQDGVVYIGANPDAPAVGDVRVRFRVVRPGPVSLVARQTGTSFEPYRAQAGGTVFLLEEAVASADSMFQAAETSNTILTWILRAVGFFVMYMGLGLVLRPISTASDIVPALGRLASVGVGFVSGIAAAIFAFVTIAFAWFVYRPLLSLFLVAVAVTLVVVLVRRSKKVPPVPQAAAAGTPPPPPPIPT